MTDEELKAAKALADAATSGPWVDAAFIVASLTLVPKLLDEVERLRAENAELRKMLPWIREEIEHKDNEIDLALGKISDLILIAQAREANALRAQLADSERQRSLNVEDIDHVRRVLADTRRALLDDAWVGEGTVDAATRIRKELAEARQHLASFARSVTAATKHGPVGRGGPGPCDSGCVKCEGERIVRGESTPQSRTRQEPVQPDGAVKT